MSLCGLGPEPLETRSCYLLRGCLREGQGGSVFKVLWGSNLDTLNLGCILVAFSVAPTTAT